MGPSARSEGEAGWEAAFKDAGVPAPDDGGVRFAEQQMSFAWRSHCVAAGSDILSDVVRAAAETKGWALFELPATSAGGVPDALVSMFKE